MRPEELLRLLGREASIGDEVAQLVCSKDTAFVCVDFVKEPLELCELLFLARLLPPAPVEQGIDESLQSIAHLLRVSMTAIQ